MYLPRHSPTVSMFKSSWYEETRADLVEFLVELFGAYTQRAMLEKLVSVVFTCMAVLVLFLVLLLIDRLILRLIVTVRFGVRVPPKCKVRRNWTRKNEFHLGAGAYWTYAKRDGTRDKRRRDNRIKYRASRMSFGSFTITSGNQLALYWYVNAVRSRGTRVALSVPETRKLDQLRRREDVLSTLTSITSIYERFQPDPYGFEDYVGEVFSRMGYLVEATEKSNDGGIDLKVFRGGALSIVECKCFQPESTVGRPIIQKAVGAGLGVSASTVFVVTTAKFSLGAKDYAQQTGVVLIDGEKLLRKVRALGMDSVELPQLGGRIPELSPAELLERVPADLVTKIYKATYDKYFVPRVGKM